MKRVALTFLTVAGLALAGLLAAVVPASPPPGTTTDTTTTTTTTTTPATIPTGVKIATVDVGGLAPEAATAAVQQDFDVPIELLFGRTRILVSPDVIGATAAVQKAVERALASQPDAVIPLGVAVDQAKTVAFVARLAKRFDRRPADSRLFLRHLRPWLSKERTGQRLDQKRAVRELVASVTSGDRLTVNVVAAKLRPKVTRRNFGAVIVIRRGQNRLMLYHGMRYWRSFGVATGQRAYPTPLGRFSIVVKWRNPWWYPPDSPWAKGEKPVPPGPDNPLGTRWMGLSAPGVGIHGTPSDGSIGYSVSHGCIRMHIPQAEWLFTHVGVGTPVFIVPG